jgi:uncharacterized membrane protein YhaH (DUF805 family)
MLWNWNRTIGRTPYFLTGVILVLVKYTIDGMIANAFGESWSPFNYLIWPNDRVLRILDLGDAERRMSLTMLLVSLPFLWTGIMLTFYRLRDAGLPLVLIVFFFVPLLNLLLFLILVLLPARKLISDGSGDPSYTKPTGADVSREMGADTGIRAGEPILRDASGSTGITSRTPLPPRAFEPLRELHRSIVLESYWLSGFLAIAITVPCALLAMVLGAQVLQSYGFSLFVGAPFTIGMVSVLLFGFSRPKPLGACLLVALAAMLLAGVAILFVALEGAICLIMAAPIVMPIAYLGAGVGYIIQRRPWLNDHSTSLLLAFCIMIPALMGAESAGEPVPAVRSVTTVVIINRTPAQVWPHVIAFPPLPEPDDWFFQTGIAYPKRAEIHGSGVGAVRHCIFSTGAFVEPIEIWNPPSQLRFRVTEQPHPMEEWSPYAIHPPHLDHYLVSREGEFLLEPLEAGRTHLVGTTWYSNRMWPAAYWHLWSDSIIHRIHERVLTHIKERAEAD